MHLYLERLWLLYDLELDFGELKNDNCNSKEIFQLNRKIVLIAGSWIDGFYLAPYFSCYALLILLFL